VNDGKYVKIAGISDHHQATLSTRFKEQIEDMANEIFL
jgi:hypothetical protein